MVTSQGLGDLYDIYPKRKKDLAIRLAKKVLKHTYGMDVVGDQPIYRSVEFRDGKAYITLDNAEGLYVTAFVCIISALTFITKVACH